MRVPRARVPSLVGFGQDSERDQRLRQGGTVRLHNPALAVARIGWVAMAALSTALFVASLPAHYTQLASVSVDPEAGAVRAGLRQLGLAPEIYAGYTLALKIAFAAAFLAIGLFIFWRKSAERLPLLLSLTLVLFGATFPNTLGALVANHPNWGAVVSALEYYAIFSFFLLFCLFPDGAFVPPWTRAAAVAWVALGGGLMFFPGSVVDPSTWPLLLSGPVFFGFLGAFLFAQVHRYRRVSGPIQRQQTKWVVFGFSVAIAGFLAVGIPGDLIPALHQPGIPAALYDLTSTTVFVCALLPVPLSIGASILRYRLWDIDVVIHHSLVYGALTAGVVGLYVLVVGYLGALFNTGGNLVISLIATGLVAVLFQPLRDRLQRGVNHLMYGERDDPYAVLARLGRRLEATLAPDAVLPTIVSTVQEALKLPYVAIALPRDEEEEFAITAAAGQPPADLLQVPLIYQGDVVGQLLLGPRAPGEAFTSADRRLLDDLAHHAGVAVHGVRVMTDLQRSRERLVLAREEERRRLRRDLHDELAPTLAALGLTAATVGELIQTDPEAAAVVNAKLADGDSGRGRRHTAARLRPAAADAGRAGPGRRHPRARHAIHQRQSRPGRAEPDRGVSGDRRGSSAAPGAGGRGGSRGLPDRPGSPDECQPACPRPDLPRPAHLRRRRDVAGRDHRRRHRSTRPGRARRPNRRRSALDARAGDRTRGNMPGRARNADRHAHRRPAAAGEADVSVLPVAPDISARMSGKAASLSCTMRDA